MTDPDLLDDDIIDLLADPPPRTTALDHELSAWCREAVARSGTRQGDGDEDEERKATREGA